MNALAPHSQRLERSSGAARIAFDRRRGAVRLAALRQQGSAKAILPVAGNGAGHPPEVVFLNTSGGLTGGDRLDYAVEVGPACRVVATTQTAERAYRATAGQAEVTVRHRVGAGGHLDWLPQETILFDRARLNRTTRIDLAGGATCLLLESVVLGRAAMGETLARVDFRDRREVWRDGRPVLVEPLHLETAALSGGLAVLDGARAFASLALVAPGAPDALGPARAALGQDGVTGAASALDGRLMVRLMAVDGFPLRRQILRLLAVLRTDPVPRVWQM